MRSIAGALLLCLFGIVLEARVVAQDDVLARARAAAADGRRAEGVALLEQHLAATPRDVDARLLYGLILSWDGKYDAARAALGTVLAEAPDYLDARVALMNVEWWSGAFDAARAHLRAVLARDPGNTQARLVQQRLDARTRPWTAGVAITRDTFSDDREPWREWSLTIGRETPVGAVIVRGSSAERFGVDDRQAEIEFYPVFRAGTYAFVGVGAGDADLLYPGHRVAFEIYQSVGRGYELSAGVRRLAFAEAATIYVGTVTRYAGNWMLTAKTMMVPSHGGSDAWSYHASVRRYFGAAGTSFITGGYGRGFAREEPRGAGDLIRVDADTLRAQAEIEFRERARVSFHAGGSRQERVALDAVWQVAVGAGVILKF